MTALLAALCVAMAIVLAGAAPAGRRLGSVLGAAPSRRPRHRWPSRRLVLTVGCAAAAPLVVPGPAGVAAAIAVGVVVWRWLPAAVLRGSSSVDEPLALAEAALACDLLAAALGAGSPVAQALHWVVAATADRTAPVLARVAQAVELGASPAEAWAPVAELTAMRPLARAAVRCADSGAALGATCSALAGQLRARATAAGLAAVRRAGVRLAGPLALCFLPSFVLLGVVPFVTGLFHGLLDR